jgi:bisanhydrobacterioruberin hydratase
MKSPINHYVSKIRNREPKVRSFLISFYIIGFFGLIIPFTQPLFLILTPFALLLSTFLLILFHPVKFTFKSILVFSFIFIVGYIIEMVGVNTGLIFGSYQYGEGLGIKIANTPLLIGLNWVLLIYLTASLVGRLILNPFIAIVFASLLMLLYDFVLEQIAPHLNMWFWSGENVPLQNYAAWFIIALFFHSVIKLFRIETKNSIAPVVFICQLGFFILIYLSHTLIK